jgi:hypothetical protein
MVGRLRPTSSCGACSPALGKPLGRCQIFRQVASSEESIEVIAADERAMRQCVCIMLELAPYRRRRCLMFGGRGVFSTALLMVDMTSSIHLRWALGERDAVSAVPRWPPGSGSSCESTRMGMPLMQTWARRVCSAVLRSCFVFMSYSLCRYPVSLHLYVRQMPDHLL